MEAWENRNIDEAMAAFNSALKANPELLWPSHYFLGLGYHSKGDNENASQHYLAFLKESESSKEDENIAKWRSDVSAKVGLALAKTEDSGRAIPYLEQQLENHPEDKETLFVLGTEMQKANRLPEAEKAFLRVLELDPKMADAHFVVGNMAFTRDDFAEATTHLTAYLELSPDSPRASYAHFMLGSIAMRRKQTGQTRMHMQRSLEIDSNAPHSGEANYILGYLAMEREDYDSARVYFQRYIRLEPSGIHAAEVRSTLNDIK
jgi:tetratricopeptide (TPR) repeat protein